MCLRSSRGPDPGFADGGQARTAPGPRVDPLRGAGSGQLVGATRIAAPTPPGLRSPHARCSISAAALRLRCGGHRAWVRRTCRSTRTCHADVVDRSRLVRSIQRIPGPAPRHAVRVIVTGGTESPDRTAHRGRTGTPGPRAAGRAAGGQGDAESRHPDTHGAYGRTDSGAHWRRTDAWHTTTSPTERSRATRRTATAGGCPGAPTRKISPSGRNVTARTWICVPVSHRVRRPITRQSGTRSTVRWARVRSRRARPPEGACPLPADPLQGLNPSPATDHSPTHPCPSGAFPRDTTTAVIFRSGVL